MHRLTTSSLLGHRLSGGPGDGRGAAPSDDCAPPCCQCRPVAGVSPSCRPNRKRPIRPRRNLRPRAPEPGMVVALSNLGGALVALQRHGEAEPLLRRALALAPDYAPALTNLA